MMLEKHLPFFFFFVTSVFLYCISTTAISAYSVHTTRTVRLSALDHSFVALPRVSTIFLLLKWPCLFVSLCVIEVFICCTD